MNKSDLTEKAFNKKDLDVLVKNLKIDWIECSVLNDYNLLMCLDMVVDNINRAEIPNNLLINENSGNDLKVNSKKSTGNNQVPLKSPSSYCFLCCCFK